MRSVLFLKNELYLITLNFWWCDTNVRFPNRPIFGWYWIVWLVQMIVCVYPHLMTCLKLDKLILVLCCQFCTFPTLDPVICIHRCYCFLNGYKVFRRVTYIKGGIYLPFNQFIHRCGYLRFQWFIFGGELLLSQFKWCSHVLLNLSYMQIVRLQEITHNKH